MTILVKLVWALQSSDFLKSIHIAFRYDGFRCVSTVYHHRLLDSLSSKEVRDPHLTSYHPFDLIAE